MAEKNWVESLASGIGKGIGVFQNIEEKKKRVVRNVQLGALAGIGIFFLLVSFVLLIYEYSRLSFGWCVFVVGAGAVVLSKLLKKGENNG